GPGQSSRSIVLGGRQFMYGTREQVCDSLVIAGTVVTDLIAAQCGAVIAARAPKGKNDVTRRRQNQGTATFLHQPPRSSLRRSRTGPRRATLLHDQCRRARQFDCRAPAA